MLKRKQFKINTYQLLLTYTGCLSHPHAKNHLNLRSSGNRFPTRCATGHRACTSLWASSLHISSCLPVLWGLSRWRPLPGTLYCRPSSSVPAHPLFAGKGTVTRPSWRLLAPWSPPTISSQGSLQPGASRLSPTTCCFFHDLAHAVQSARCA